MGLLLSSLGVGAGQSPAQMLGLLMDTIYKQSIAREITNFQDFHVAILDIFNTINSGLPGKHYDVPSRKEIEDCFAEWEAAEEQRKKDVFIKFMTKSVNPSKVDDLVIITGIVVPPAAMIAKRAGENVPQLKLMMKGIPDVVFVPSFTVLALASVKVCKKLFWAEKSLNEK